MGLAASQTRFLSLTARKSDLEYQSQIINTRRMQLAQQSADASKAYTEGMNNKAIRVATYANGGTNGTTTKEWETLTFSNLVEKGYRLIGANGAKLDIYEDVEVETELTDDIIKSLGYDITEGVYSKSVSAVIFNALSAEDKVGYTADTDGYYRKTFSMADIATANGYNLKDGKYIKTSIQQKVKDDYQGMDIQTLLVSGQAQIVTGAFYDFLVEHGYNTGVLTLDGQETTFNKLVELWETNPTTNNIDTIVDWRADETSMFKQSFYTEDDAQVAADYEAATAEIQAQDKQLELQIKRIETEHKAIETEMESVKKVIDKNIENSYKSFA